MRPQRTPSPEDAVVGLLLALGKFGAPRSHVVSSHLRRAVSTTAVGLTDRFVARAARSADDRIVLLPALQEILQNPDTLSIFSPGAEAGLTWCNDAVPGLAPGAFAALVDVWRNTGNKAVASTVLTRLRWFCANILDNVWLPLTTVVAAGHSLFYRSLFRVCLRRAMEHVSKRKKPVNGGTVQMTLREATLGDGGKEYVTGAVS